MMADRNRKFVVKWTLSYLMKMTDQAEWENKVTVNSITELLSKKCMGGKKNNLVQKWRNMRQRQIKEMARWIEDHVCKKEGPDPEARRYLSNLMEGDVFVCDVFKM